MRNFAITIFILSFLTSCIISKGKDGEPGKPGISATNNHSEVSTSVFNKKLADSLKADQYGMKTYFIVMLTTGKTKIEDKNKVSELMKGHMENIGKLAKEGKVTVAGPFLEKNARDYRGMFIFNTDSKDTAETWVKTDPAVAAGIFDYEIFKWYGSAALPTYLPNHAKVAKENP